MYILEDKLKILEDEKNHISKEISNGKCYNYYLKQKLKDLEEGGCDVIDTRTKVGQSLGGTFEIKADKYTSPRNKSTSPREKIETFLNRNEEIVKQKIFNEEKHIKEKYSKLKIIESFKNPILLSLDSIVKDYEFNLFNSKVSNQEVFFNIPENDMSSNNKNKTRRVIFKIII